jgi:hypothetical protein
MTTNPFTKMSDARPFDLAKECLSPRLREEGGLDAYSLPSSKYFIETVNSAIEARFAAPLSSVVSPEVMAKMERAAEWVNSLVHRTTGREFSFVEPVVVPLSNAQGLQIYPLIELNEGYVKSLASALPAAEWREKEKQQATTPPGESPFPKFNSLETKEALEIGLAATLVHELIHGMRGVQIGRTSTTNVRLGLRVNAFDARASDKRFSAFTEAAAILTEGRFLRQQGLKEARNWQTTLNDVRLDAPEFVALKEKSTVNTDGSNTTMGDRFATLLRQTGVAIKPLEGGGYEVKLSFIRFSNSEAAADTGYKQLHWGMEHLAAEIFRGKVSNGAEAVELFQEMLVKAEVLAEPRPLFKEIKNLAKKDLAAVPHSTSAQERALGKEYLEFFSKLRANEWFDKIIFQAFVRADHMLPADEVAKCRAELISLYKHGIEGLDITPKTNAA